MFIKHLVFLSTFLHDLMWYLSLVLSIIRMNNLVYSYSFHEGSLLWGYKRDHRFRALAHSAMAIVKVVIKTVSVCEQDDLVYVSMLLDIEVPGPER